MRGRPGSLLANRKDSVPFRNLAIMGATSGPLTMLRTPLTWRTRHVAPEVVLNEIAHRCFDIHQLHSPASHYRDRMSDIDAKLARCEHHIADLALRIAELKETSTGAGSLASTAIIAMLQRTA